MTDDTTNRWPWWQDIDPAAIAQLKACSTVWELIDYQELLTFENVVVTATAVRWTVHCVLKEEPDRHRVCESEDPAVHAFVLAIIDARRAVQRHAA